MAPLSPIEINYNQLLNRGTLSYLDNQSPLMVSVPIKGISKQSLTCWYNNLQETYSLRAIETEAFWVDMNGERISEHRTSVRGEFTTLRVGGLLKNEEAMYACVVRLIGVGDLTPVIFAVYKATPEEEAKPSQDLTYSATSSGTMVCEGKDVVSCQYRRKEPRKEVGVPLLQF